jgi:hypothetical protein
MPPDQWLKITEIASGHGADAAGSRYLFLRMHLASGEECKIAVPVSEAHKLVQLAFQAVSHDAHYPLVEKIIGHVVYPLTDADGKSATRVFEIDGFEIGIGENGALVLTLEFQKQCRLSFTVDNRFALRLTRALEDAAKGRVAKKPALVLRHPFLTVAEDIEWFRDDWVACAVPPTSAELRRASGTLRHLLLNQGIRAAWRYCGLPSGPQIVAPDLVALMTTNDHKADHAVITLAGGIQVSDVECACMSMRRVFNPATGQGPDADEGFAVEVGTVMRQIVERANDVPDPRWAAVRHDWRSIDRYIEAPGAIRRGEAISRRSILTYFANYSGGVHLDRAKAEPDAAAAYALHEELDGRVDILGVDGLHAELLAMGQAIGSSPDMIRLAATIREAAERNATEFAGVGFSLALKNDPAVRT